MFCPSPAARNVRSGLVFPVAIFLVGLTGLAWAGTVPTPARQDVEEKKTAGSDQEQTLTESKPARPAIYDGEADAAAQIAAAVAKAKKENRRVLIQWGANWCGWCHLLHDCFRNEAEVRRTLQYEYDLVLVDVGHADKNLELAEKYGADFAGKGLPYLTILDGDGKTVVNQETESLESSEKDVQAHDPKAVAGFLVRYQAKPLVAADVYKEGLESAASSKRLVLLHFGAPWCGWCHRMEDWMARPENAEILQKYFVDLKIDTDRMEGGGELLEKTRGGKSGGIPWFAFIDPATEKVLSTSDGPDGNLGFPWTDEEIAGFGRMLESVGTRVPAGDAARLTESLRQNRIRTEAENAKRDGGN